MSKRWCSFNVLKYRPIVGLGCCALLGSFENEAKEFQKEQLKNTDVDNYIIDIHRKING